MKTADQITIEMATQDLDELQKALPPEIARKMRAWFHKQGARLRIGGARKKVVAEIAQKMEAAMTAHSLQKNQMMARVHDSGVVRLDFGSEVPEKVRKAAMEWAKRRGLSPVEATMNKSANAVNSVVYAKHAAGVSSPGTVVSSYILDC